MKMFKSVFPLVIVVGLIPGVASADIYDWTFGGGSDSVSGFGTLTTVATAYANIYLITGGSGTLTDPTGTYNVSILPLNGAPGHNGNFGSCGNISTPLDCATLQNPPASGGINVQYDNLLYLPPGAGNSELDANGIVLYNAAGPQTESYFDVWSAANSGNPLPDNFLNTVTANSGGFSTNLDNPFTVNPAEVTPEPGYGILVLGLLGMVVAVRHRRKSRLV